MMLTDQNLNQALSKLKAGEIEDARQVILDLLREEINNEWGWYLLSFCVSKPEEQNYALQQTLRINPENDYARTRLTGFEHEKKPSLSTLPEPLDGGTELDVLLGKAAALLKSQEVNAAREALKGILQTYPKSAAAWYLYSQAGHNQLEQQVYLRQALRLEPEHKQAKHRLDRVSGKDRQWEAALEPASLLKKGKADAFLSFSRYTVKKVVTLFATVVIGLFITILIANMGGYVDQIFEGMIAEQMMAYGFGEAARQIPEEEREEHLAEIQWQLEDAMGLHDPFMLRTLRWLVYGLTLNFGESYLNYFFGGVLQGADTTVRGMVFKHLPYTLTLIGFSNLLLFITSVSFALYLSRKYGTWMDRICAALASLSSAPSWIFGIILIVILSGELAILPFPKVIDLQYAEFSPSFIRLMLSQMVMPVMAIFFSVFFQGVYAWRTFFLIYSQEDYVEMARAMGLSARRIERLYILKPTFPYVITNFAMLMITIWESSIALEVLFYWPGIGPLFLNAANSYRTSLIVAIVVVFAYLLAVTVFILDFVYAIVDPRVRLGDGDQKLKAVGAKSPLFQRVGRWFASLGDGLRGVGFWIHSIIDWIKIPFTYRLQNFKRMVKSLRLTFKEIRSYPSAIIGFVIIILLILVSAYTLVKIPYEEAITIWSLHNATGKDQYWAKYPRYASPAWTNLFRKEKLPETIQLSTQDGQVAKSYESLGEDITEIEISFSFDYPYGDFPDELSIFFESQYEEKLPHISLTWLTPDNREIQMDSFSLEHFNLYRIVQNERLVRKLGGNKPNIGLFLDPDSDGLKPLKGPSTLKVSAIVFEAESDIDCEFVLYGRVYGLAGTDNHRRDLMVALLWGTPVALAFGLFGAVGTS
ncbi:MAG: ABC transporter permease subunit, partial [Anaerolineales bacterium]|nr:ABC transporter permease subunit [Anaerolineales bacterium]